MKANLQWQALAKRHRRAPTKDPRKERIRKGPGPEALLQMTIIEHLTVAAVPGCLFFSIPNEGKRSQILGIWLKKMGMLPGVADLFVKPPDRRVLFLECKAPDEQPREDQLGFAAAAMRAGCDYKWTDDIDDALALLRASGALRGAHD